MAKVPFLIAAALAGSLGCVPAFAQVGPGSSGAYARPMDMGPHDTASDPGDRDRMINGIRADSVERSAEAARAASVYAIPAGPRAIVAGAQVNDRGGKPIGTVEATDAEGAVVFNGSGRVKVPLDAFGRNRKGLMLDVTKSEFDKMVARANEGVSAN